MPPNLSSETYLGAHAHFIPFFFPPKYNMLLRKPFPPGLVRSPWASLVNLKVHRHTCHSLSASSSPLLWPSSTPLHHPQNALVFSPFCFALSAQGSSDPTAIGIYRNNSHNWARRKEKESRQVPEPDERQTFSNLNRCVPSKHPSCPS